MQMIVYTIGVKSNYCYCGGRTALQIKQYTRYNYFEKKLLFVFLSQIKMVIDIYNHTQHKLLSLTPNKEKIQNKENNVIVNGDESYRKGVK